jgi:hypothetical protein
VLPPRARAVVDAYANLIVALPAAGTPDEPVLELLR